MCAIKCTIVFFFWPCGMADGILVPPPGIETGPWQWKCWVLTTGPPGNSLECPLFWWTCSSLLPILVGCLTSQWAFIQSKISSHSGPLQRGPFTYFFPRPPCYQFSNHISPKSLAIQLNHGYLFMNQCRSVPLAISLSRKSEPQSVLLKFLSPGSLSLHQCLSGPALSGAVVL